MDILIMSLIFSVILTSTGDPDAIILLTQNKIIQIWFCTFFIECTQTYLSGLYEYTSLEEQPIDHVSVWI